MDNPFKKALHEKRVQIGLWQGLANAYTAEICAGAGFDWLLLDGEHAPNDPRSLLAQLQAVEPYPVHPIGRVPFAEPWIIKQYLDIGISTLLVPLIDDEQQAAEVVRATRYPPEGIRGVGSALARASRWSRDENYLAEADDAMCVLVQVETRKALERIDEIAAVEGVDGVFIGPADLSASLGYRGRSDHPEVQKEIEDAILKVSKAGKAPGILTGNVEAAERYIGLGCLFVGVGTDVSLLVRATDDLAASFGRGRKRN